MGRPRRRWEDNIRMGLEEIGINAGNWVDLPQDRDYWRALVNAALKPLGSISHGGGGVIVSMITWKGRYLRFKSQSRQEFSPY